MSEHLLYGMDTPEGSIPVNNTIGVKGFGGRQIGAGTGSNAGWTGNLGGHHKFNPFSHAHLHPDPQKNIDWRNARNPHRVNTESTPKRPTQATEIGCCSDYPNPSNNYTCGEDYHY